MLAAVAVAAFSVPAALNGLEQYAASSPSTASEPAQRAESRNRRAGRSVSPLPGADPAPALVDAPPRKQGGGWFGWLTKALLIAAAVILGIPAAAAAVFAVLSRRRLKARRSRHYERYELHLSMHDEAKPRDLEDMVEAIGNIVRAFPEDRLHRGQPYIAFEMHYGPSDDGMEWGLFIVCEPELVQALDGVICAAYPDVRVGRTLGGAPTPEPGRLPIPGHVLRFRKSRSLVYAINSDSDEASSPPLEAIAQQQANVGVPSSVRIQLIPTALVVENFMRRRYHRHENKLTRQETLGLREAGLRGQLNRQEMTDAKRTQNRGLFWLELQVAADTRRNANKVAAAVMARRGDNRLQRRIMILRQPLYRRRFPAALPPLWPTLSLRTLVSALEVAHLLQLPTARLRAVPVRRNTVPRIPAPPEVPIVEEVDLDADVGAGAA